MLAEGDYEPWMPEHDQVYAYIRHLDGTQLLVLNNFSNQSAKISITECFVTGEVLNSNYDDVTVSGVQELEPYQTIAIISRKF
ncbi:alpha-glucosidase C-terminal domain-containing protein [Weissella cibaria]|uniref:alpha-glucosidase C-terminal domain-containing protein n=1 Tax=Weissella cibaria TaxID=137591 RepID=UPI001F1F3DEC|nr:alpha-glucosidase C-terminal domain-containing protein [Weissella cibaria]